MKVDLTSIPFMINSNQLQSDISAFLGNSTCNLRLEKSEERVYGYSKSFLLPYIIRAVDQGSYIKDRRLAGLSECFSIKRPDMENHKQRTLPITLKFQKLQTIFHFPLLYWISCESAVELQIKN